MNMNNKFDMIQPVAIERMSYDGMDFEKNSDKFVNNLIRILNDLTSEMTITYGVKGISEPVSAKEARKIIASKNDSEFSILDLEYYKYLIDYLYDLVHDSNPDKNKAEIFDYIFNMVNEYLAKVSNNTYCVQNWEQLKGFLIDSFECWKKDQYYRAAGNDKSLFQEPSRIIAQLRAENDKLKEQIAIMQNQQTQANETSDMQNQQTQADETSVIQNPILHKTTFPNIYKLNDIFSSV